VERYEYIFTWHMLTSSAAASETLLFVDSSHSFPKQTKGREEGEKRTRWILCKGQRKRGL
jgi:hypothetical protein